MLDMDEHREKLERLFDMMWEIVKKEKEYNKMTYKVGSWESIDSVRLETICSIRELSRMYIKELNSVKMNCVKDDDVVLDIKSMTKWLEEVYGYILKNKKIEEVKILKIVNQLLEDYSEVYEKAKVMYKSPNVTFYNLNNFEFGRKEKEYSNNNQAVNLNIYFNGDENMNRVNIEKITKALKESLNSSGRIYK
jgi:hypothetical protein